MKKYANDKNYFYNLGQVILKVTKDYIKEIEKYKMTNEQFFIDWEDKLNELSIKDHNADPE